MIGRNLDQRLKRLEFALTPATPQILTIRHIAAATGEIFSEHHLELLEPNHSRRAGAWAGRTSSERSV